MPGQGVFSIRSKACRAGMGPRAPFGDRGFTGTGWRSPLFRRTHSFFAFALSLVVLWFACPLSAETPGNLVLNGDFAEAQAGKPAHWDVAGDAEHVQQSLSVVTYQGHRCARLACTRFTGSGPSVHAMLAEVGGVRLVAGTLYELSCLACQQGIQGRGVSLAIQDTSGWVNCGLDQSLQVGEQWRPYRFYFRATRTVGDTSRLQLWFAETGTLYVADIRLVSLEGVHVAYTHVVPPSASRNLVPNGSFCVGGAGWSSVGVPAGWGNLSGLVGTVMPRDSAGNGFLRIPIGTGPAPALYFDYLHPVVQPQTRVLAANDGWIPLEKGAAYTVSCDMRASSPGLRAALGVYESDPAEPRSGHERLQQVELDRDWKRFTYTFHADTPYSYVEAGPDLDVSPFAGGPPSAANPANVDVSNVQLQRGETATEYVPRSPLEVGIQPMEPAGLFTVGEPACLRVRACNHGSERTGLDIRFDATDYFGRAAPLSPLHLDLAPASMTERQVPLPAGWRGFYRVRASYTGAGRAESSELRLAVLPRREEADSVLGINHAFADNRLVRLAAKAGVAWYRDWSLKRQDVEPSQGQFRWEVADPQIDRVLRAGANVEALLPPFPSAEWDSEAPTSTTDAEGRARQAWAPKDREGLAEFEAAATGRYRQRVRVWEFLNEPIYTDYALPRPRYSPADYVGLLRIAAQAMRRGNPGCRVMGGIAGGPQTLSHDVLEAGILSTVDLFNLHIYPGSRAPEGYIPEMDRLLKDMDDHGGRKPIWITEFSYYADDEPIRTPFIPSLGDWAEQRLLTDERQCAEYTVRFITIMLAHGAEKVFIHSGASGTPNQPNLDCCLFGQDGAPRKVLPALAVMTNLLGAGPRSAGFKRIGHDGYAAAFETGRRAMLAVWSSGAPFAVHRPAGARCLDIMGRDVTGQVSASGAPVYLLAPRGHARALLAAL